VWKCISNRCGGNRSPSRGRSFAFFRGETIHTENSYKSSAEAFEALASRAGWLPRRTWVSDAPEMAMFLLSGV
jgi:uncharacterized SAM-dependent methyltransferase